MKHEGKTRMPAQSQKKRNRMRSKHRNADASANQIADASATQTEPPIADTIEQA
ncbi:hypothetical protein [Paraburkholderia sp. PGU19]|uniref:hypothetical protein n=1 Tax=Paraburkholderia sp. PGU19 TaxID=2735434 RepID=UPI0015DBB450|nr:hypothetical protein [Paraburkholderia sp. PGU19]